MRPERLRAPPATHRSCDSEAPNLGFEGLSLIEGSGGGAAVATTQVALLVAAYLGAGGLPQGQVVVNSAVASVAQVCAGISTKVLDGIKKASLATSESFLKEILRHYKTTGQVANRSLLLHARAKLYFFRMGKLLQGWPITEVDGCRKQARPPLVCLSSLSPLDVYAGVCVCICVCVYVCVLS